MGPVPGAGALRVPRAGGLHLKTARKTGSQHGGRGVSSGSPPATVATKSGPPGPGWRLGSPACAGQQPGLGAALCQTLPESSAAQTLAVVEAHWQGPSHPTRPYQPLGGPDSPPGLPCRLPRPSPYPLQRPPAFCLTSLPPSGHSCLPWPGLQGQPPALGPGQACSDRAYPESPLPRRLLTELAGSMLSGMSPPTQPSTVALEDLELLLAEALTSPEPLSLEETPERYERSHGAPSSSVPKPEASKYKGQLEQCVADLQADVACLRGHKERCEHVTLGLLRELLQVRTRLHLQTSAVQQLQQKAQQVAPAPEKEAPEVSLGAENQMQVLEKRLVEVREALMQIQRTQALQNSERKGVEQEMNLRLTQLTDLLRHEEQSREVACEALQKSQKDTSQKVDREVAKLQVLVTKRGEEMSLRFLKREAKLCGFLQKSFLTLEQRMKTLETMRLKAEDSLREELEVRWQKLLELTKEHMKTVRAQRQEGHLLGQCQGLDAAVVQLTTFVRQNQLSLSRVLLAEQKAREAMVSLEESQAGELASYIQENLEAVQLAGKLAQQETQSALELLQEKSQALEGLVADMARQLKDLSDHCLALSWRLDLQEQTLGMKLSQVKTEWECAERKSQEDLALGLKEVAAQLRAVQEQVDDFSQKIEGVSEECAFRKSDADLKISVESKARKAAMGLVRQELASLQSSMQLLKEDHPGRKIAEIQGNLATFQKQVLKLEDSIQANKTIQNLKFNTETKLREEKLASLRETVLLLWSEAGPWPLTLGSKRMLMSLVRQRFFVKDVASGELVSVNRWGVYQALRWLQWKAVFMNLLAQRRPGAISRQKPVSQLPSLPPSQK
ncbi:PREDICTED: coiled-coil domain-containing protein 154 [Dipodomys ordii]|uniref:Coiled-coil domain-containing protein 154 n=1 Tax=Dipodomys ordii TaxID=10020 RepID=A0A1S3EQQ2_DIPOR|nr:PREDICTED: coiled-coil domain-containing protein 154 [Dipodomys ordii]